MEKELGMDGQGLEAKGGADVCCALEVTGSIMELREEINQDLAGKEVKARVISSQ